MYIRGSQQGLDKIIRRLVRMQLSPFKIATDEQQITLEIKFLSRKTLQGKHSQNLLLVLICHWTCHLLCDADTSSSRVHTLSSHVHWATSLSAAFSSGLRPAADAGSEGSGVGCLQAGGEAPAAAWHAGGRGHSRAQAGRPGRLPLPKLIQPLLHHAPSALRTDCLSAPAPNCGAAMRCSTPQASSC